MPRLEDWEISKYWQIFQGLKPVDNKVTGDRVSPVLKNSRLTDDQLSQIWELSDIDSDGKLDFEEFCITMRLIFDLVNGSISSIPLELPNWLIPSSKAHLIQANRAVTSNGNNFNTSTDDYDEDETLSDDFDWYITPTDRLTYETIYNANCDSYGRVKFDSLDKLYDTLSKVPKSDVSSAWNLVNPKSSEAIDKDQVLVFLHILNQRENGRRIPRGVPASLRATFSKEQPSYDINSVTHLQPQKTSSNGKKSFANDYLTKIGQSSSIRERGTDFSATEGTDWEVVRLKRELNDLESLLREVQRDTKKDNTMESSITKHEFEQLLKFKESQLKNLSADENKSKDLVNVKGDIELIESQVTTLEDFLNQKTQELSKIRDQVQALRT
ncbi:uncharacterized protein PRCAT00003080001 [Priceomyces carsonii]|uniref:uncharacterized protein n=1 Tax=Priceomyces carsonii TaxID=28549 RepID=UPI002EDA972A|nr:unnamed protein product [Priceomyces carsonii]